tara:strand:+ start:1896 stop:2282 length:387 start_codon:yes stop_codon:yes gene_type:complete
MIAGHVAREPELKPLPSGSNVCSFSIAVNRIWKDKDGAKKGEVTFVEVVFFGKTAENIARFFSKGTPIFVEGRLSQDSWDDKETGKKRTKTKVVGESFEFVGATKKEPAEQAHSQPSPGEDDGEDAPL